MGSHPWKCSENPWMWCSEPGFSCEPGLDDLGGFFPALMTPQFSGCSQVWDGDAEPHSHSDNYLGFFLFFFLGEHWEAAPQFSWLDSAKDHTLSSGSGREQRLQPGISHCFRGMLDSLSSEWGGDFACLQTEFFPVGFDLQIPGPSGP